MESAITKVLVCRIRASRDNRFGLRIPDWIMGLMRSLNQSSVPTQVVSTICEVLDNVGSVAHDFPLNSQSPASRPWLLVDTKAGTNRALLWVVSWFPPYPTNPQTWMLWVIFSFLFQFPERQMASRLLGWAATISGLPRPPVMSWTPNRLLCRRSNGNRPTERLRDVIGCQSVGEDWFRVNPAICLPGCQGKRMHWASKFEFSNCIRLTGKGLKSRSILDMNRCNHLATTAANTKGYISSGSCFGTREKLTHPYSPKVDHQRGFRVAGSQAHCHAASRRGMMSAYECLSIKRDLRARGADDSAILKGLPRGKACFSVWSTLSEHKWSTSRERRGIGRRKAQQLTSDSPGKICERWRCPYRIRHWWSRRGHDEPAECLSVRHSGRRSSVYHSQEVVRTPSSA